MHFSSTTVENNYGAVIIYSDSNVSKRSRSDINTTAIKKTKSKHLKVYLSDYYGQTDFGEAENEKQWTVNGINMTAILKTYREKSIGGALMRKRLTDERTLFAIMISLNTTSDRPIEETTMLICFQLVNILQDKTMVNEQQTNDKIDAFRMTCVNQQSRIATRIVSSLLRNFFSLPKKKESESNLTIEMIRPFLKHVIISTSPNLRLEWITYRMSSLNNDG